jgi:hypothetical protein
MPTMKGSSVFWRNKDRLGLIILRSGVDVFCFELVQLMELFSIGLLQMSQSDGETFDPFCVSLYKDC